jgi:peptidoglycan/LPS O-acetylase OafA/YrhL
MGAGHISQAGASGAVHRRYYGIEYLRFALAAVVMLFHYFYYGPMYDALPKALQAGPWLSFGPFAVFAFFVISGFVISLSAEGKTWGEFIASRISRLVPALIVCATLTYAVVTVAGAGDNLATWHWIKAVTFLPMMAGGEMIDESYWSIAYEMRFYALVLILLATGLFAYTAEVLTVLALVTLVLYQSTLLAPVAIMLLFPHAAFFALGVLLYRYRAGGLSVLGLAMVAVNMVMALVGAVLQFAETDALDDVTSPKWLVAAVLAGALGLVGMAQSADLPAGHAQMAALLGGMSYPLYLIHQALGFEVILALEPVTGPALAAPAAIAVVLALAYAVHVGVERRVARPLRMAIGAGLGRLPARAGAGR